MEGALFPTGADDALPDAPACPFCGSKDTRRLSLFGGQLSVAQHWCNHCRTGFEYLKWEAAEWEARGGGPAD